MAIYSNFLANFVICMCQIYLKSCRRKFDPWGSNVFPFGGCEGPDQARQALHRQQCVPAALQGLVRYVWLVCLQIFVIVSSVCAIFLMSLMHLQCFLFFSCLCNVVKGRLALGSLSCPDQTRPDKTMNEESLAQPVFCMVKTRSRPNVSHAYAMFLMFVQFFIVPGNLHHPAHCFHPSHRQTIHGWVTHTNSQKEKEEDNEKGKSKQYVGGSNLSIQKDR